MITNVLPFGFLSLWLQNLTQTSPISKFLCSNSDYNLSLPKPSLSPQFSLLNLTLMEFNCTKRKLHNGNVNYHLFCLYGLPLNHLGFLCLSIFMLKELWAKRKFTLGLPRFEPTTMQCQTQCQTIQPIHISC